MARLGLFSGEIKEHSSLPVLGYDTFLDCTGAGDLNSEHLLNFLDSFSAFTKYIVTYLRDFNIQYPYYLMKYFKMNRIVDSIRLVKIKVICLPFLI